MVKRSLLGFIAVLVLAVTALPVSTQESRTTSKQLWTWFGDCTEKASLGFEILLDGKVIYKSSFPICPISDVSKEVSRTVAFHFKGGHVFDGQSRTDATESIEGSIWQAGADPGVILFGVSFSTGKQVLLNTIHIAEVDKESTSELDRGLAVRTFRATGK
jgi:hypothetical protein